MLWNWFRRRKRIPPRRVNVICYPIGESLIDVSGFYHETCESCGCGIAVSPTTAYAVVDGGCYGLLCVHCGAKDNPEALLSQDFINEAFWYMRSRRDLCVGVEPVKTLGGLSRLLNAASSNETHG
jgi:hypothetical protein